MSPQAGVERRDELMQPMLRVAVGVLAVLAPLTARPQKFTGIIEQQIATLPSETLIDRRERIKE